MAQSIRVRNFSIALLRRLLQADRPAAARTDEDVEEEARQNYTWNFGANLTDGALFWLAQSFISSTTILPLFVSKLSDNPFYIGLLAVVSQAGWFFPQLLSAGLIERTARKKPWVVNLGFFVERMPVFLLPLAAYFALDSPGWALFLFLLLYSVHFIGAGLIAPAWQDLIAACFPPARRGRLMGVTMFVGALTGALGAFASSRVLDEYLFPQNFLILFIIAAVLMALSWIALAFVREPVRQVQPSDEHQFRVWTRLGRILRRDQNFRRFLIARSLLAMAGMARGFVTVAAVYRWDVPDSTVGYYTIALLAGQAGSNLLLGLLADRKGHKVSLVVGGGAVTIASLIAWLAVEPALYYLVFVLIGVNFSATFVSGLMIVLEFVGPEQRPTYIGVTNSTIGAINLLAPLIGGWLATIGYSWLFAVNVVVGVIAVSLLWTWVADPRHTTDISTVPAAN